MEATIERTEALYLGPQIHQPKPLYRMDGGDTRWYYDADENAFYPSVTSVIQATMPTPWPLIKWMMNHGDAAEDKRDERAAYGTWLHIQIGELLIHGEYDLDRLGESIERAAKAEGLDPRNLAWYDDGQKDILAFAAFMQAHDVRPIAIEVVLSSQKGYAGAIDLVCDMKIGTGQNGAFLKRDGEGESIRAIVDIKSGRKDFYENHEIQLHMYRDMWHENFPAFPVDRVFNWSPKDWRGAPSWKLKDQTDSRSAAKIPHLVTLFRLDGREGPGNRLTVSGKITPGCDLSTLYRYENMQVKMRAAEAA